MGGILWDLVPQDPTSWLLPLRGMSGTGAGGVRGCGAPQGARRGADTDVLGQPSRPPGVMSPLRPPCLLPQPGSRQPVVSLSGCTRLTPVLLQPFLTPKEQTSDLGWQNLISASRVCLSYVLILATWARPGDCLTPNSGGHGGWWGDGRPCSLTITRPRSLPGQAGWVRTSSSFPSFYGSPRVQGCRLWASRCWRLVGEILQVDAED